MRRALVLALTLGLSTPAGADELESAADHHVAAQGSYRGGLRGSWEYKLGSGRSAVNITGVAAHGLLGAFRLTGLQEHQDAALRAARSLIRAHDAGWSKHRPFTQDIEFLVDAGFLIDAARWFNVTRGNTTAEGYASYVLDGRKASGASIAGWDLASAIRAAIAVGQLEYARGLLATLIGRRSEWDRADRAGAQRLARGSLLWALGVARDRLGLTPEQRRLAEGLLRDTLAAQRSDGAWQERAGGKLCTQTTAYAVLGLTRWPAGKRAAELGRAWLRKAARGDSKFFVGGHVWATTYHLDGRPENDYNSEIQSEAMLALASGR